MKRYVLDSYALIAYSREEKGAESVAEIIDDGLHDRAELYLSVINWGEIYYITLRNFDRKRAELFKETIARYPIIIVEANRELTLQAAEYKAFKGTTAFWMREASHPMSRITAPSVAQKSFCGSTTSKAVCPA